MIGQTVSHYKILKKIGAGGMGEVYLAEDMSLGRKVAIKFLSAEKAADPESRKRFIHEARAQAIVSHSNVATFHEVGEERDKVFIVMEYIEGQRLSELAKTEKLSLQEILNLAIQVGEGLQAAHEKGVMHRDINPTNILVSSKRVAKITDFGLAKWTEASTITRTGLQMGTDHYMSPEQVDGRKVDHRTDIFSFGVVLYELICACRPFDGTNRESLFYEILYTQPQPLARYCRGVPEGFQIIVDKALKKDKSFRYQSAADLLADLKGLQKELTEGGVEAAPKRKTLAVLPFENLGAAEDEYFADGITDEITTKLAKISALGVISRTSAIKYKKTEKTLRQIGAELGIDYVLEGTIRWHKSGTTNRVRINSQLIRVEDDTHLWAETYDRVLEQIFELQSDIADKVTRALQLALSAPPGNPAQARPTDNLEAYNYYLRGSDYFNRTFAHKDLKIAVDMYEKAIKLDPNFALAYAMLSWAHSTLYWVHNNIETKHRLKLSKEAADQALRLNPDLPETRMALGYYHYWGNLDYSKALEQFAIAQNWRPNDSNILRAIGTVLGRQGNFNDSTVSLTKALELDPLNAHKAYTLGTTYLFLKKYEEAERYFERAIELAPDWAMPYAYQSLLYISWQGNTTKAKLTLERGLEKTEPMGLVPYLSPPHLTMLLSILNKDHLERFDRLTTEFFEPDTSTYYMFKALLYDRRNQLQERQTFYNSARVSFQKEVQARPQEPYLHSYLGLACAALGQKGKAIREGKKAVELLPVSKDAIDGLQWAENLACIYAMVDEFDCAIGQIEYLLSIPTFFFSVPYLQLNPVWTPLRSHPRLKKLLTGR